MIAPKPSRSERGSAMLEGALCFTVFLMIVFGIVDFGRAVFAYNFVSYAAHDATRYAAVRGSSSTSPVSSTDVTTYVKGEAIALDPAAFTVTTAWSPDNKAGSTVSVKVRYNFASILPYMTSQIAVQST